jgi:PAP2 superfamily
MPHLELGWQPAAIIAVCLGALAAACIQARRTHWAHRSRLVGAGRFGGEAALLFGLFALWQYAGSFSVLPSSGGLPRGWWLWHAERALHLPSETAVQRIILPHPLLVETFNLYYAVLHFPVLIGCLIWLFVWHRGHYRPVRTTVVLFTGVSLLIQFIPVAPPRMLTGTGLVDTAAVYGQSVYGSLGIDADQFSAMPSVHVGWALIVAIAVITASRSRWRWLAVLYPAVTTLVVVATANHFWLDGVAAAVLVVAAMGVQRAPRTVRVRLLTRRGPSPASAPPGHGPVPAPLGQGPAPAGPGQGLAPAAPGQGPAPAGPGQGFASAPPDRGPAPAPPGSGLG